MRIRRPFVAMLGIAMLATGAPLALATPRATDAGYSVDYDLARVRELQSAAVAKVGAPPAEANDYFTQTPFHVAHTNPDGIVAEQPDGTSFRMHLRELEVGGGLATESDHLVVKGDDGWWRYGVFAGGGRIDATKAVVGRDAPSARSLGGNLTDKQKVARDEYRKMNEELRTYLRTRYATMSTETIAAGEPVVFKVPGILFQVNNEPFQPGNTAEVYEAQYDGIGSSPTGTVTEVYLEQSFGNMIVDFDMFGPYTVSISNNAVNDCWYGTNGGPVLGETLGLGGYGAKGMAEEVIPQADPDVDFSEYDNDGDGYVDFTLIVHSGRGAESSGDDCDVWSHYFAGLGPGFGAPSEPAPTADGVLIGAVMTVPELDGGIGVTAHELMHALGEPDYYGTAGTAGTGDWDLGAGGSWLGIPTQTNPIHFNPVMKIDFGWIEPTIVDTTTRDITLRARASNPDMVMVPLRKIAAGEPGNELCDKEPISGQASQNINFYDEDGTCYAEGFLIENFSRLSAASDREACTFTPADFDRQGYGSGLMIWHWDFTNYQSLGNNNVLRPMLDLEEFDRRDAQQDMSVNKTRAERVDLFYGDPVGISSATFANPESLDISPPDGSPYTLTAPVPAASSGTSPEWTVPAGFPAGVVMTIELTWDTEDIDDWDLSVEKSIDGEWVEVASAGAAPGNGPERVAFLPEAGGIYRGIGHNYSSVSTSAKLIVDYDANGLVALGTAGTNNNDFEPTGWSFTNIRPLDYNGIASGMELPGAVITFDAIEHDATTVDVSPNFLWQASDYATPFVVGKTVELETKVFNHGGKAVSGATFALYDADPATGATALATKTVDLAGFGQDVVTFNYTPRAGYQNLYVRSTAAGDLVAANDIVRTEVVASQFPTADILVVDTDRGMTQEEAVAGVLAGMGVAYHVVDGLPSAETLKSYDAVIWVTATASGAEGVMSKDAIKFSEEYLRAGGNIWLQSPRATGYFPLQGAAAFSAGFFGVVADNNLLNSWGTATGQGGPVWGDRDVEVSYVDRRAYFDLVTMAADGAVLGKASALLEHENRADRFGGSAVVGDADNGSFRTVWSSLTTASTVDAAEQTRSMREVLDFFGVTPAAGTITTPTIQGYRIEHLMPGRDHVMTVGAVAPAGIASVALAYRTFGDEVAYTKVPMTSAGDGMYTATLPGADVFNNGVQYYVEALTNDGQTIRTAAPTLPNAASAGYGDAADVTYGNCADAAPAPVDDARGPAPLPTTGGGLALAGLVLIGASVVGKRRRLR